MALSVRAPLQKTVFGCMVCGFALHQQLAQQGGRHLLYFNVLSVLNRRLPQSVQCHCVCFGCNSNQVLRRLQFLRFARRVLFAPAGLLRSEGTPPSLIVMQGLCF